MIRAAVMEALRRVSHGSNNGRQLRTAPFVMRSSTTTFSSASAGAAAAAEKKPTIIYTLTDEAPLLATYSFLPILQTFASR